MKKILILVTVLILPLILFACGGSVPMERQLRSSGVLDAEYIETLTYDMYEGAGEGRKHIGNMIMTFEVVSDTTITVGIEGKSREHQVGSQPHYYVTMVLTNIINGDKVLSEVLINTLFLPVMSYKEVNSGEDSYSVLAWYVGRTYNYILTKGDETPVTRSLNMRNNLTYDNEMILAVLRFVPISAMNASFSFSFRVPSALNHNIDSVTVRAQSAGTFTLTDVEGSIPVVHLNIGLNQNIPGEPIRASYAPLIVKEDDTRYQMVLTNMVQGDEKVGIITYALKSIERSPVAII